MEQIIRKDGQIFYGEKRCIDAEDAYCRFRADYHASIGREAFLRINRIGQREERIHGYGFSFAHMVSFGGDGRGDCGKVSYRILGLVGMHYCRIVGSWDLPGFTEEEFERWFDWAFSRGSGALRLVGKNDKSGRTSKRLKTRYR